MRQRRIAALPSSLAKASLGTVTFDQLRHLLAAANLLVQVNRPDRDPGPEVQHALHAAASRCAVAILGDIAEDDPRRDFAHVFPDIRALRLFVSRLTMDPVAAQMQMQTAWRTAHRTHSADSLALRLAQCADPLVSGSARPRATVVTPTFRPERIRQVLDTFRMQTWPDRELIIVANTDHPDQWEASFIRPDEGEQVLFLPRRFGPGTALNMGGARASGDYILRMDDDDYYSPHYVEDMMLGAAALRPDIMGKLASFYFYVDENRLVYKPSHLTMPEVYPSAAIDNGGHLAGFSHAVSRPLLARLGYSDGQHGGVDTGFLDALIDAGDLLCARADSMNAVVERRSDVSSHTWQTAPNSAHKEFNEVGITLQELLSQRQ